VLYCPLRWELLGSSAMLTSGTFLYTTDKSEGGWG